MSRARFEAITGRYMHLDIGGRAHRLYVEEAGQGIPSSACIRPGRTGGSIAAY